MRKFFAKELALGCLAAAAVLVLPPGFSECQADGAAKAKPKRPPAKEVFRMGDAVMTDAELADELAWTPPEVLLTLKQNSSTARQFALDWYTRRLFSAAAESDGTFRRVPGLEAASKRI